MLWPFPTKPTRPGQFLLLIAVAALALFAAGGCLVYLSFGQPTEKAELAMQARWLGIKLIASSLVVGLLTWLGQRFIS
jgi:hypothetical protein